MLYRKFARTGIDVSALGFGCMRLPLIDAGEKPSESDGAIAEPKATEILRRAIYRGVN